MWILNNWYQKKAPELPSSMLKLKNTSWAFNWRPGNPMHSFWIIYQRLMHQNTLKSYENDSNGQPKWIYIHLQTSHCVIRVSVFQYKRFAFLTPLLVRVLKLCKSDHYWNQTKSQEDIVWFTIPFYQHCGHPSGICHKDIGLVAVPVFQIPCSNWFFLYVLGFWPWGQNFCAWHLGS